MLLSSLASCRFTAPPPGAACVLSAVLLSVELVVYHVPVSYCYVGELVIYFAVFILFFLLVQKPGKTNYCSQYLLYKRGYICYITLTMVMIYDICYIPRSQFRCYVELFSKWKVVEHS